MFLINITGQPTLNLKLWFGIPENLILFKNLVVNHSLCTSLFSYDFQSESKLIYSFSSPGTNDRRNSFTCTTASNVGASIHRSWKNLRFSCFAKILDTKSTRERNESEESFISNSSRMGMLISPLSLADPIPSPIDKLSYLILVGTNG